MNSYTYNDVSWKVFGEVNNGTVVRQKLNTYELHQNKLTSFLWNAMRVMSYTCKDGQISYTISETDYGYSFQMQWTTTKVKAQTIEEYIELLKGKDHADTGKTEWRKAIDYSISALLDFSSVFNYSTTLIENTDLCIAEIKAEVKFSSLIDTPNKYRFYKEAPQRQLSIFDVFEFEEIIQSDDENQFKIKFEHSKYSIWATISYKEKAARIDFSEYTSSTHHHLVEFLSTIINIYHKFPDEINSVNVFCSSNGFNHFGEYSAFPNSLTTEHTRFCNYDGPSTYTMDVKRRAHYIRILVRKNPDLEYEDNWFYHLSDYEFSLEHELKPKEELERCILLAVELNQRVLLRKVYNAVQDLIFDLGLEKYEERFENDFPQDLVSKLKQLIDNKY